MKSFKRFVSSLALVAGLTGAASADSLHQMSYAFAVTNNGTPEVQASFGPLEIVTPDGIPPANMSTGVENFSQQGSSCILSGQSLVELGACTGMIITDGEGTSTVQINATGNPNAGAGYTSHEIVDASFNYPDIFTPGTYTASSVRYDGSFRVGSQAFLTITDNSDPITAAPEPRTIWMLGSGLLVAGLFARRRTTASRP
ncbi:MAG: PEP-CTERM sorting domain-containing protein [Bryobacteraceae bacterium]